MPAGAEWAIVALTEDVSTEATSLAGVAQLLRLEARKWKHPEWRARLELCAADVDLLAENLLLIADEGDYWRMRTAIDTATEQRRAAHLILTRATRSRESLFAPSIQTIGDIHA